MDDYPSISRDIVDVDIYAFDKLDGSQIRCEWDPKKGFWKFGTRTHLTDENDADWGEAVKLVKRDYADAIHEILKKERFQKALAFFEYYGPSSFAGTHKKDEDHTVILFDFRVHKKGILPPNEFLRLTRGVKIAELVFHGKANSHFVDDVKNRRLPGMTFEGVVCKSVQMKTPGQPWMFKVKSQEWIDRLKAKCSGDEKLFNQLL